MLFAFPLSAQNPLRPCFKLPATVVCAPATVTPIDCSGAPPNLIVYDYGDGQLRLEKSFTFTRPGRYSIRQGLNTLGAGGNFSEPIELVVLEPRSPVFSAQVCNERRAIVRIMDNHFPTYQIDWGDGSTQLAQSNQTYQHSYNAEGNFTITVKGITDGDITCGTASQRIEVVFRIPAPVLKSVQVLADGRARISYTLPPGFAYRLRQVNILNNAVEVFDLPAGSTSFTAPGVTSAFDRYTYSIEAVNPCAPNSSVNYLNQITTHFLRVIPMREMNRISWTPPAHFGFSSYTLFRNGVKIGQWSDANILQYEDRDITCGERYCYRLEVSYYNGIAVSITQEECFTTPLISNPPPLREPMASVINQQVQLTWQVPERTRIARLLARRMLSGQTAREITLPQTPPPFVDNNVFTSTDVACYQLSYIDHCGNQAPWTPTFCTTVLTGSISGDSLLLNWRPLNGYRLIAYTIEQLDEKGNIVNIFRPTGQLSLFIPVDNFAQPVLHFRLAALVHTTGGTAVLYSNTVRLRLNPSVTFPTAFSPNNDGLNDTFGVTARFISKFSLQIFNRWGELVYYSDNPAQRWDGSYKGSIVPAGIYALVIQAEDALGRPVEYKATLLIAK